jgi:hypothetical protein
MSSDFTPACRRQYTMRGIKGIVLNNIRAKKAMQLCARDLTKGEKHKLIPGK